MELNEIVVLKVLPLEKWRVIDSTPIDNGSGKMFCCSAVDEPRFAIWVKESEVCKELEMS